MSDGPIQETMRLLMRPWIGSCAETEERLSGHLESELPPREERRVRRHLAHCRRCRRVYESLARAVEHIRSLAREDLTAPMPSVVEAVTERIRHERR